MKVVKQARMQTTGSQPLTGVSQPLPWNHGILVDYHGPVVEIHHRGARLVNHLYKNESVG